MVETSQLIYTWEAGWHASEYYQMNQLSEKQDGWSVKDSTGKDWQDGQVAHMPVLYYSLQRLYANAKVAVGTNKGHFYWLATGGQ